MLKENKGVTLIALLIAIIVLLALAGTAVYLVFGKNGVAAESPIVVATQDKNYAENIVTVGLKAVRREAQVTSTDTNGEDGTTTTVPPTTSEKMELLMDLLEKNEFTKESDTVITYKSNGNSYKITVNLENYTITKIE